MTEVRMEADVKAQIERLKFAIRDIRRRIEHARSEADKRALNRQIGESLRQIENLQARLLLTR